MFKTIEKTAHHIATVQDMLGVIMQEFLIRAQCHDRSKFTEDELTGYARFENMPEGLLYGSDEYKAEMAKIMEDNDCFKSMRDEMIITRSSMIDLIWVIAYTTWDYFNSLRWSVIGLARRSLMGIKGAG